MKRENFTALLSEREIGGKRGRLAGHTCFAEGLRMAAILEDGVGCVNTVEWHPSGSELLSSGDDLKIDVWDTSEWRLRGSHRTGHAGNVFCVKYVPGTRETVVTAAADGDVRLTDLERDQRGDKVRQGRTQTLSSSPGDMTLKIEFLPGDASSFLTTHRDGSIRLTDLRVARRGELAAAESTVVELASTMFFSLSFDPTHPQTFAAGCGNHFVRLYDLRMGGRPYEASAESGCVKMWTDPNLLHQDKRLRPHEVLRESRRHVTDVQFSSTGDLLCNFADNDVVLFHAEDADMVDGMICTSVKQRFCGRQNVETFLKEARFLGDEEFVVTGSDSGEVFIWSVESGQLVHRVTCDKAIVNGVEPHPFLPTLAVCGIDPTVKILEYRGGGGIRETDSLKEQIKTQSMSFRQRMLMSPEVVLSDEVQIRLVSADQERKDGNERFRRGNAAAVSEAKDCYNRALQLLKFFPPSLQERRARDEARLLCLLNLAQCYLMLREYRSAARTAASALTIDPHNVKGYFRLAKAQHAQAENEAAMEAIQKLETLQISDEDREHLAKLKQQVEKDLVSK